jgi:hypothetical protein
MQKRAEHDRSAKAVTHGMFQRELAEAYNNVVR